MDSRSVFLYSICFVSHVFFKTLNSGMIGVQMNYRFVSVWIRLKFMCTGLCIVIIVSIRRIGRLVIRRISRLVIWIIRWGWVSIRRIVRRLWIFLSRSSPPFIIAVLEARSTRFSVITWFTLRSQIKEQVFARFEF